MTEDNPPPSSSRQKTETGSSDGTEVRLGQDIRSAVAGQAEELRIAYAGEIEALKRRGARRRTAKKVGVAVTVLALAVGTSEVSFGWRSVDADSIKPATVGFLDGSRIYLDVGGKLEIPLAPWRREARLVRGNAVFDIVHDSARPFVVRTPTSSLTDLGTRFLVRADAKSSEVAVFEGKVEAVSLTGHRMALGAGQAAKTGIDGLSNAAMPDESQATDWSRGRLVFKSVPLALVVSRLSSYSAVPVILNAPKLADMKVSGNFRLDDIAGALKALEIALPVRIKHLDGKAVIEPATDNR